MWKILIADDEAMERNALREILEEKMGCFIDVRTAADGAGAVEIASIWKADIALLDIKMPGMDGVKAAAAIRHTLPQCQIIFLTAYGLFEYAQEAIRLGVSDYILKPSEDEEVIAAVRRAGARLTAAAAEKPESAKDTPLPATPAGNGGKNSRLMQQVESYLRDNFARDISLDGLAQTLNFSPFYLSKMFKQYFGTSFIEYLTDLRVQAAKEYLTDPTKSAKEIGEMVGYPNSNYFAKMFKKKTGITPTEYRNSL